MRVFASLFLATVLTSCSHVRHIDAEVYGGPPEPLKQDVTVIASFKDAISVSVTCGRKAMGPLGSLVPSHGCVHARAGKPVEMVLVGPDGLRGTTRIVEFVAPGKAPDLCALRSGQSGGIDGLPEGGCQYQVAGEDHLRIIWPNPCDTGDAYMCHELGHVNQFALGWQRPSFSPAYHWGRPPTEPRFVLAETDAPEADSSAAQGAGIVDSITVSATMRASVSHHHVPLSGLFLTGFGDHRFLAPVPDVHVAP